MLTFRRPPNYKIKSKMEKKLLLLLPLHHASTHTHTHTSCVGNKVVSIIFPCLCSSCGQFSRSPFRLLYFWVSVCCCRCCFFLISHWTSSWHILYKNSDKPISQFVNLRSTRTHLSANRVHTHTQKMGWLVQSSTDSNGMYSYVWMCVRRRNAAHLSFDMLLNERDFTHTHTY